MMHSQEPRVSSSQDSLCLNINSRDLKAAEYWKGMLNQATRVEVTKPRANAKAIQLNLHFKTNKNSEGRACARMEGNPQSWVGKGEREVPVIPGWNGAGMQGRMEREYPEKTCWQAASYSTIPTCKNLGANPPGIEPGSPWWEASVSALVKRLDSCTATQSAPKGSSAANDEEEKVLAILPWLPQFSMLSRFSLGSRNIKQLKRLMSTYLRYVLHFILCCDIVLFTGRATEVMLQGHVLLCMPTDGTTSMNHRDMKQLELQQ
ncbi:hypothetical protein PR048_021872 [Dryococelus australis]|uniref:Uncharacterized protein n=1 Tax=Dryococelus australis TaxID=614101 RepID=A0ABQ9GZL4_9NEOP|nr:hypothetical protein PR048_021872 [Dryococelus australis]